MHIKKLCICGFKTYKEATVIEFDDHYNCIVGLNGSGKSNILNAIAFIMSDAAVDRASGKKSELLHEGVSRAVDGAFVEIWFDNTDRSFCLFDNDTVVLRREIQTGGLTEEKGISHQDKWSINGRQFSRKDFAEVIESVGVSRTNPYNIVRQGKIAELGHMTDKARYDLICQIAGVEIYEQRRKASLELLGKQDSELEIADETFNRAKAKMEQLQVEQKELEDYLDLEKRKRCIEYHISDTLWQAANTEENEATQQLNTTRANIARLNQQIDEATQALEIVEDDLTKADSEIERITNVRQAIAKEILQGLEDKSASETRLNDNGDDRNLEDEKKTQDELARLEKQVHASEKSIAENLQPSLLECENNYRASSNKLKETESEISQLCSKSSRSSTYTSVEERNKDITKNITSAEILVKQLAGRINRTDDETKQFEKDITNLKERCVVEKQQFEKLPSLIASAKEKTDAAAKSSYSIIKSQKKQQDQVDLYSAKKEDCEAKLQKLTDRFFRLMKNSVRLAIQQADTWKKDGGYDDESVPGMLIKNLAMDSAYFIAVETVGRLQLLNYVVKTNDLMKSLAKNISSNGSAWLTISPLDEISKLASKAAYPQDHRVKPLIECMSFPDYLYPAVFQVFGRALLCDTFHTAQEFKQAGYDFDYVTVEGDTFLRNNTISGGFVKQQSLKFFTLSEMDNAEEELKKITENLIHPAEEIALMEKDYLEAQEQEALTKKREYTLITSLTHRQESIYELENEITSLSERISELKFKKNSDVQDLEIWKSKISVLKKELSSPLKGLTPAEKKLLKEMQHQLRELEQQEDSTAQAFYAAREALALEENKINHTLKPSIHKIKEKLTNEETIEKERERGEIKKVIHQHKESLRNVEEKDAATADSLESVKEKRKKLTVESTEQSDQISQLKESVVLQSKKYSYFQQVVLLKQKEKDEANAKRFTLAGMPPNMSHYTSMSFASLEKELIKVEKQLTAGGSINRKASSQYNTYFDSYKTLLSRKEKLNNSRESILLMLKAMDDKKDQVLQRTFESLEKNFSEIFQAIVPEGNAQLIQTFNPKDLKEIQGTSIRVSFLNSSKATHNIHQLSGGQKTLIALALIFAIQRCDPAPFYVLDEIDAALDEQYRSAVATQIANQSKMGIQFILTTFRPELLEYGQKFFLVRMVNRCSAIEEVGKHAAIELIQNQEHESTYRA